MLYNQCFLVVVHTGTQYQHIFFKKKVYLLYTQSQNALKYSNITSKFHHLPPTHKKVGGGGGYWQ